jgi:hypothetical protein
VSAFVLARGSLGGMAQAECFLANLDRIVAAATTPGPCVRGPGERDPTAVARGRTAGAVNDTNGLVARLWNDCNVFPAAHDDIAADPLLDRDQQRKLDEAENLPAPEVLAAEIVEDLEAALAEFAQIAATLGDAPV